MTKKLLFAVPFMLFLAMASCQSKQYTKYECPMKCEGAKTYKKADSCPVCGMELEGVE